MFSIITLSKDSDSLSRFCSDGGFHVYSSSWPAELFSFCFLFQTFQTQKECWDLYSFIRVCSKIAVFFVVVVEKLLIYIEWLTIKQLIKLLKNLNKIWRLVSSSVFSRVTWNDGLNYIKAYFILLFLVGLCFVCIYNLDGIFYNWAIEVILIFFLNA